MEHVGSFQSRISTYVIFENFWNFVSFQYFITVTFGKSTSIYTILFLIEKTVESSSVYQSHFDAKTTEESHMDPTGSV